MTFAIGHVQGGTNAGRKIQKPAPRAWECGCVDGRTTKHYRQQPGYMVRCPDCRTRRPV